MVRAMPTSGLWSVTVIVRWLTVTLVVSLANPGLLAVIVALPGPAPVTSNVALVWPAGTVTVDGTVAASVLLLARLTTRPFAPAAPLRLTVSGVVAPTFTFADAGVSVITG